jgi:hypothetical protein
VIKHETSFYRRVNKHLPVEVHAEKMSNPFRGGMPDFWYSGYKADLWVEFKWSIRAPVRSARVGLQALQKLWLNDANRKRRNVCVIIGSPQGCAILRDGAWMYNVSREQFKYDESAVTAWIIGQVHASVAALKSTNTGDGDDLQTTDNVSAHRRTQSGNV